MIDLLVDLLATAVLWVALIVCAVLLTGFVFFLDSLLW